MAKRSTKQIDKENMTDAEQAVLQAFFPKGKEITIKDIMKKSNYSYEPVYRTLQSLVKGKIVNARNFGKTLVYDLNFSKTEAKIAFYHYTIKRAKDFFKNNFAISSALSEIPEEKTEIIIIFGSYAKGTQRKESDIDVIAVSQDIEGLKQIFYSLKRSHNKDFAPVILQKSEFAKIKKENKEFWQDLVEYGIIFKGHEPFYHYAYLAG